MIHAENSRYPPAPTPYPPRTHRSRAPTNPRLVYGETSDADYLALGQRFINTSDPGQPDHRLPPETRDLLTSQY